MGNLFASFNTGVSGLHSAQSSLYTTAHNIANATTEGYSRQQVIVTDAFYSTRYGAYANRLQIGKGTDIAEIRQVRNTFLDAQYRVQAGRQSFYEAQYKAVQEIEDLFGGVPFPIWRRSRITLCSVPNWYRPLPSLPSVPMHFGISWLNIRPI